MGFRCGRAATVLVIASMAAAEEAAPVTAEAKDMLVIRERMLAPWRVVPDAALVTKLRQNLRADGSWPDINYAGTSTTAWEPARHLSQLLALTQAWFVPESPSHADADLAKEVGRALDFWLRTDPRRPWWWDCIGAPGLLSQALLMYDEQLSDFQRRKGTEILSRAILGTTGQNLIWQAEITSRRAALQRDPELLRRAYACILAEIKVGAGEGIQPDFSFHQHGSCLYNHGYGAGFATDNARLAVLTAGTAFAYPPDRLDVLTGYVLDGSQWLAHGAQSDFGAEGREITRPRQTAAYLAAAARDLLRLPTGRESELQALADRIAGKPSPPLVGNRHFYRSDIMVHHRPGWYMSARTYSTRTLNTDGLSGCDEGLLSHYLAEGATCIMQHGNEYRDLMPVWDWQRLPGTTVELAPHRPGEPRRKGETAFAGGVSDGSVGIAAFQLQRGPLQARKAWFFCRDVVVCLGAGIRCESEHAVVTTVNQCRLIGPVQAGGRDPEILPEGEGTRRVEWLHHDGIGYVFPRAREVNYVAAARTGNWQRISAQRRADPVTEGVFALCLDHGTRPDSAEYAYAVFPGADAAAMPARVRALPFSILANSPDLQAVAHPGDGSVAIVFYVPGQFEGDGWQVRVDRACAVLLRQSEGAWRLSAADPAAAAGTLTVTLSRQGGAARQVAVALPAGPQAGASVTVPL